MRVLVVDDHRDTADLLAMLLASAGHETRTAYRGDHALAAARSFDPALVFLDIQLPDTTGFAVARQLRMHAGARLYIVGMTGGNVRNLAMAGAFDHHEVKPLTASLLLRAVATADELFIRRARA